ncbi:hypothetical protein BJ912DRAFT_622904 [Pholiota molesta]|nr:hypothetical protein BJ912DRAFT_622904 [Pholiota molesta]
MRAVGAAWMRLSVYHPIVAAPPGGLAYWCKCDAERRRESTHWGAPRCPCCVARAPCDAHGARLSTYPCDLKADARQGRDGARDGGRPESRREGGTETGRLVLREFGWATFSRPSV